MSTDAQITRIQVLEQILQTTREGFWFIDNDTLTLDVNSAMCDLLGRAREDIIGRPIYDFVDEENGDVFRRQIAARANGESGPYEVSLLQPDGTNVPCVNNANPILNAAGEKIASIGLWTNISDIKAAQDELKRAHDDLERTVGERTRQLSESEQRFRGIFEHTPASIILKDLEGRYYLTNHHFAERYGVDPSELVGKTDHDIHPSHIADRYAEQDREILLTKKIVKEELQVPFAKGEDHWLSVTKFPVENEEGLPIGIGSISVDITEQRLAEARLRQAQKMEAIGQLTGGVAHDFNNLLMIIQVSTELIDVDTGRDNDSKKAKILRAVKRGAELTDRLLAFSRRQPLNPEAINVAELVNNLSELLSRTLGETVHIKTRADLDLWTAIADPGQVENALLNLTINARDAMPDGGQLTVECSNWIENDGTTTGDQELTSGDYVVLSVTDQGTGMSDDIRNHAFEPFFTTKEVGQGSGLGLSMVYGFAKQSGGHVRIYSEEGHGTTIRLYLPRNSDGLPVEEVREKEDVVEGQEEVILIVEDDLEVRQLTAEILISLNYQVVSASRAAEAQEILNTGKHVDLVLSDVILPGGQSGWEFAKRQRQEDPSLRFVFMSGYPADSPNGKQLIDPQEILISKPFQRHELARVLRRVLT